jgi:hypothetical protein
MFAILTLCGLLCGFLISPVLYEVSRAQLAASHVSTLHENGGRVRAIRQRSGVSVWLARNLWPFKQDYFGQEITDAEFFGPKPLDIATLEHVPTLERIEFHGQPLVSSNPDFRHPKVENVDLWGFGNDDQVGGTHFIRFFPHLWRLRYDEAYASTDFLTDLAMCSRLERLHLTFRDRDPYEGETAGSPLGRLTELRLLRLWNVPDHWHFQFLQGMEHLHTVEVSPKSWNKNRDQDAARDIPPKDRPLHYLARFTKLRSVDTSFYLTTDDELRELVRNSPIETLTLGRIEHCPHTIGILQGATHLRNLRVDFRYGMGCYPGDLDLVRELAKLRQLHQLSGIHFSQIDDDIVDCLAELRDLKSLYLSFGRVALSDDGWSKLHALPITSVTTDEKHLSDEAAAKFKSLKTTAKERALTFQANRS